MATRKASPRPAAPKKKPKKAAPTRPRKGAGKKDADETLKAPVLNAAPDDLETAEAEDLDEAVLPEDEAEEEDAEAEGRSDRQAEDRVAHRAADEQRPVPAAGKRGADRLRRGAAPPVAIDPHRAMPSASPCRMRAVAPQM